MTVHYIFENYARKIPRTIHFILLSSPSQPVTPNLDIDRILTSTFTTIPSHINSHAFFNDHIFETFTTIPITHTPTSTIVRFRCFPRPRIETHFPVTVHLSPSFNLRFRKGHIPSLHFRDPTHRVVNGRIRLTEPIPLIIDHVPILLDGIASVIQNAISIESVPFTVPPSSDTLFYITAYKHFRLIDGLANWDTSHVTSLRLILTNNPNLPDLDALASWDTSHVTDLEAAFNETGLVSIDGLASWDTSRVTNLRELFRFTHNLTSLSGIANWDTSHVTSMKLAFACTDIIDADALTNWNTSRLVNASALFYFCRSLPSTSMLAKWNTSSVEDMDEMLMGCESMTDLRGLTNWNTSRVTMLERTFRQCAITHVDDLAKWNISRVDSLWETFALCPHLRDIHGLHDWNIRNVRRLTGTFAYSGLVNVDGLDGWDVSDVTNFGNMFGGCRQLRSVSALKGWNMKGAMRVPHMFSHCESLESIDDLSQWRAPKMIDMTGIFYHCRSLRSAKVVFDWVDISKVVYATSMLGECESLDDETSTLMTCVSDAFDPIE